jgi:hypothetical protein
VLNLDAGLSCLDIAEKVMKVTEVESNFENFVARQGDSGNAIRQNTMVLCVLCSPALHNGTISGASVHGEDEVNSRNNERLGVKANTWTLRACE